MGYLAIIGFPPFSGFWSKDKIIETALDSNPLVGLCALLGAGITGFYMTRLMLMTYFTDKRWEEGVHPHESPKVMTVPLIVLAVLSVVGGILILNDWIVDFLAPVVGEEVHHDPRFAPLAVSAAALVIVGIGAAIAWFTIGNKPVPREAPQDVSFATRAARRDLYGDDINEALVVNPGRSLVGGVTTLDRVVVDGAVEGGALAAAGISGRLRLVQNGFVRSYALSILVGALLIVLALLAVNFS